MPEVLPGQAITLKQGQSNQPLYDFVGCETLPADNVNSIYILRLVRIAHHNLRECREKFVNVLSKQQPKTQRYQQFLTCLTFSCQLTLNQLPKFLSEV